MADQAETPIRQYIKSLSTRQTFGLAWRMASPRLYFLFAVVLTVAATGEVRKGRLALFTIVTLGAGWALHQGVIKTIGLANYLKRKTGL